MPSAAPCWCRCLGDAEQAVLTTTDWDDFSPEFRAAAQLLTVAGGVVSPA